MKNTKKITDINDYSKEVGKIIATKKPIDEQFMDLMGLMDVTFIDMSKGGKRGTGDTTHCSPSTASARLKHSKQK